MEGKIKMFESLIPQDTNPREARERIGKVVDAYEDWLEEVRMDLSVDTDAYVSWERDINDFSASVTRVLDILDDEEILIYERMFEYIHDITDSPFKTLRIGEFSTSLLEKLNQIDKSKRKTHLTTLESRLKSDAKICIFDENYDTKINTKKLTIPTLRYYNPENPLQIRYKTNYHYTDGNKIDLSLNERGEVIGKDVEIGDNEWSGIEQNPKLDDKDLEVIAEYEKEKRAYTKYKDKLRNYERIMGDNNYEPS